MKANNEITGFNLFLKGKLLRQEVFSDTSYAHAYERSIDYEKPPHSHDRLNLAFPRGSSVICFKDSEGKRYTIDKNHFFIMKEGVVHEQFAHSKVWDNLAFLPCESLFTLQERALLSMEPRR